MAFTSDFGKSERHCPKPNHNQIGMTRIITLALLLLSSFPEIAHADRRIPGPIRADVVKVIDGDTIEVNAMVWPGVTVNTKVRVDGIDTPEIDGKCDGEKAMAIRALEHVRALVGTTVWLRNVRFGKFAGRVIADIQVGKRNLARELIQAGLARAYRGGRRRPWCPAAP